MTLFSGKAGRQNETLPKSASIPKRKKHVRQQKLHLYFSSAPLSLQIGNVR
jgi:hypothetical protein